MHSYITEMDIRGYVMDRTAADHLVLPDIAFTPEDIATAMKWAARKYNSIPPFCHNVHASTLPDESVFLDACAMSLFEVKRVNVSLNDMDYSADGVSVNVQGNLLKNLNTLIDFYGKRFDETARAKKVSMNLAAAYGPLG